VIESYLDGTFALALKKRAEQKLTQSLHRLGAEEAAVLAMLQQRLKHEASNRRKTAA
jgi:DNA topoisomerase-1